MLNDLAEIAIIANARQKNVRDPNRSRAHFERLAFPGQTTVDLGPGHYDFGMLARAKGAQVYGVEKVNPGPQACALHEGIQTEAVRLLEAGKKPTLR